MTLIGALDRVRADEQPRFLVKGGVSMELRPGLEARSTQDVDIVFRGRTTELLDALEEAFEHPRPLGQAPADVRLGLTTDPITSTFSGTCSQLRLLFWVQMLCFGCE